VEDYKKSADGRKWSRGSTFRPGESDGQKKKGRIALRGRGVGAKKGQEAWNHPEGGKIEKKEKIR